MNKPLIIITGASSGIGAVTAKAFSDAGCAVAMLSRNRQSMEQFNIAHFCGFINSRKRFVFVTW